MRVEHLETPPIPLIVDPETFDAFSWCPSTTLEWRVATDTIELNDLDDQLPLRMAFVLREPWEPLPVEYAFLHVGRALGLRDEVALAPWALDDATDLFHAHRRAPGSTLWLAADNLNALYWALHDWSHFHNHGPFTDRPSTELQCDAAALAWLWKNRARVPLPDERWERLRLQVVENHYHHRRKEPESPCPPPRVLEDPAALRALVGE